jgi:hypothetical protein
MRRRTKKNLCPIGMTKLAHRPEAMDVLASIELKFAMLQERVYFWDGKS